MKTSSVVALVVALVARVLSLDADWLLKHAGNADAQHARNFDVGKTLVYVTPWNRHGDDVAKLFTTKLDYVAPVWFSIIKSAQQYQINGEHEVNDVWMRDVRSNASRIGMVKIVPRFSLELASHEDIRLLVEDELEAYTLADSVVEMCKRHGFDGAVLESPYPTLISHFIKKLGSVLHKGGKELVLTIKPKHERMSEMLLFGPEHIEMYKDHVDYFSLMTYDYSAQLGQSGPNAPIQWVKENILRYIHLIPLEFFQPLTLIPSQSLLPNRQNSYKILVGLNFYGMKYETSQQAPPTPIIGTTFLELLQQHKPAFDWDEKAEEHYIIIKDIKSYQVWYPTLPSLTKRVKLIEEFGCGISIWEGGQGLDYFVRLIHLYLH